MLKITNGITVTAAFTLLSVFFFSGCQNRHEGADRNERTLYVFSASSMTDLISEAGDAFANEASVTVKYNFASSGTLARQIEQGARADIFISANRLWCNFLEDNGLSGSGQSLKFAENQLVLIVPKDTGTSQIRTADLDISVVLKDKKLALGDPEHVPAGMYGLQALNSLGWMDSVNGRLLKTKDVRTALMLVELAEAGAGLVYATDALKSEKVRILSYIPETNHDPVSYFLVRLNDKKISTDFEKFMRSAEVESKLEADGFKF